jgi:hypothetical protein
VASDAFQAERTAAGDSACGSAELPGTGTRNNDEEWHGMSSALLQGAQRAAVAAVVGGVARSTVARIPIVGAACAAYWLFI